MPDEQESESITDKPKQDSSTNESVGSESFSSEETINAGSEAETDSSKGSSEPPILELISEKVELTEEQVKELLAQLNDNTPGPEAPTESYTHPVTGREVYVPKAQKEFGSTAALSTMALLMFIGGGLATLMMVARAFDLHGDVLVAFVIGSCAVILGMAGGLLVKTLGNNWWVGAVVGACFGVIGGILIYSQTSHHAWWH